jgi:hypothetical protein
LSYQEPHTYLAAFYVSAKPLDETLIREHLTKHLPDYMVPGILVAIDHIPLTINGKLDRKALPTPEFKSEVYIAPRDEAEALLCQIWQEILGVEQVGITDDFFRLGGHSILAILVVFKMNEKLPVRFSVVDIFRLKTVQRLAEDMLDVQNNTGLVKLLSASKFTNNMIHFVHSGFAGSESYQSLAQALSPSFHSFGIEHYYLYHNTPQIHSLDELASHYLDQIRLTGFNPSSIILCGWSWGGNIALEMAYQLELQGHFNIYIYLIDSVVQKNHKRSKQAIAKDKKALRAQFKKDGLSSEDIRKRVDLLDIIDLLNYQTIPKKLQHSQIVLFKAMREEKRKEKLSPLYDNNVQHVSEKPVTIIPIDATHFDIIGHVDEISQVILGKALY